MVLIETQRLILRTWEGSDLLPFSRMNEDPAVMEFFPGTLSHDETVGLFTRITAHIEQIGYGLFAVELKETGDFIGFIGLNNPNFTAFFTPCVEIGWRLGRQFWGRGYATEGAGACLQHGFSVLKLEEIVSFTTKANTRSIRVMERIGMVFHGEFEHPNIEEGHPLRTHVLYKIARAVS